MKTYIATRVSLVGRTIETSVAPFLKSVPYTYVATRALSEVVASFYPYATPAQAVAE